MGNSRANIKIHFSIYGMEFEHEFSINYCPNECCGMDSRVVSFFSNSYQKAWDEYCEREHERNKDERERRIEECERSEYERLKQKFEK